MESNIRTVVLTAKTHKGKNKIKQWGTHWFVVDETENELLIASLVEQHKASPGNGSLNLLSARWISKHNDSNFDVQIGEPSGD